MLFNSIDFAIFLPIVFVLYWFVTYKSVRAQNILLLISSYTFYGWWDYRFLALIIFSTGVDYIIGLQIGNSQNKIKRKIYLWISIVSNIGLLGFFKYYNFFVENFEAAYSFFGYDFTASSLHIILPVGISFYTFQTLSYTIDIYKNKLKPTRDILSFASFVSFFPQLVAGPIERASNLLPQILSKRTFSYENAANGTRLILWGLFKKIVIADSLAPSVNEIFSNYTEYSYIILIMGAVFFAFQIYCDFSGYSSIARGLAKLLGIELMINFDFPYFSRSIAEFWRKWHISLSTWFRDYVYIPLGGSRVTPEKGIRNVFIIFIVSGFWHGANWTFIFWGILHALLFIPSFVFKSNRKFVGELSVNRFFMPNFVETLSILRTFILVTIGWVFFRADNINIAFDYLYHIYNLNSSTIYFLNPYDNQILFKEFVYLFGFIFAEYLISTKIINLFNKNIFNQIAIDTILLTLIILNIPISSTTAFIYFQF